MEKDNEAGIILHRLNAALCSIFFFIFVLGLVLRLHRLNQMPLHGIVE